MATGHLRPASCTSYTRSELESSAKERSKRDRDWNGAGTVDLLASVYIIVLFALCWSVPTAHNFGVYVSLSKLGPMEDLIVAVPSTLTSLHLAGWKIIVAQWKRWHLLPAVSEPPVSKHWSEESRPTKFGMGVIRQMKLAMAMSLLL